MEELPGQKDHTSKALARLNRRIGWNRALSRFVLYCEALLPHLMPVLGIVFLYLSMSWFGIFRLMPVSLRVLVMVLFLAALVWSIRRVLLQTYPGIAAADRFLETVNGLPHQAIGVLHDAPAVDQGIGRALWREHQNRMARRIGDLSTGFPAPDLAVHDPYGLRALPALTVVFAFAYSFSPSAGSVFDVLHAPVSETSAVALRIDAWVTPPAYTGKAPIYLTSKETEPDTKIEVPQFSALTVRISGGDVLPAVTFRPGTDKETVILKAESGPAADKKPVSADSTSVSGTFNMRVDGNGTLTAEGRSWDFVVIPDKVPVISFDMPPRSSVNGALEIGFKASDDYGLSEAHAEIVPVEASEDAQALYPLPEYRLDLPKRNGRDVKAITSRNLTEHPLSGKQVRITLVATDGAGQTGRSTPTEMILPARAFQEPLAAAVAEQRQVFALDVRDIDRAIELSEALTLRPDETIPNTTHYLLIESAKTRVALARDTEQLRDAADYLWQIALGIDNGDVAQKEKAVRDAQQALSDALARNAPDAEIKKLMDELRKAMDEYMEALAKQMQNDPDGGQQTTAKNLLREDDLKKMMDQIENLARSGARDEASKMLSEMQRMMNNLQTSKRQQGGDEANGKMREQMDKLGKLMQDQQKLMDETFSLEQALEDRMQRGDPDGGEDGELFEEPPLYEQMPEDQPEAGNQEPNPLDKMTKEQLKQALKDLKAQQEEMQKRLQTLTEDLSELGAKPGKGFGEAEKEMKGAAGALGKGQGSPAIRSQGKALEALRDGAKEMMQNNGQGQGQGQGQAGANPGGEDPLGRSRQMGADNSGEDVKVPDEIDIQRAREILESIRKKLGTNLSPDIERQYLERLLDLR